MLLCTVYSVRSEIFLFVRREITNFPVVMSFCRLLSAADSNQIKSATRDPTMVYPMQSVSTGDLCLRVNICNQFNLSDIFRDVPKGNYEVIWRVYFDCEFRASNSVFFTSCVRSNLQYISRLLPRWSLADSSFGTEAVLVTPTDFQREDWISIRVGRVQVLADHQFVPVKFWMKDSKFGYLRGVSVDYVGLRPCKCFIGEVFLTKLQFLSLAYHFV